MKRLALLLIFLLLFTGCAEKTPEQTVKTRYLFDNSESGLFPFYCIGDNDELWRVEQRGAYSLGYKVSEQGLVNYLEDLDTVIFATDISVKNGVKYSSLLSQEGRGNIEKIGENVRLDTVRIKKDGSLLFIDNTDTLYYMRDGIVTRIETGVAQSEFVNEDTFLFRLKGEENRDVAIYSATADFRNYLMDGTEIIASDSDNGKAYIIKNRHTVQKRTAIKEVADCYVYADGEILFDIPSVELTQFEENKQMFLLSLNEDEPTVKYDLYRIDGPSPKLIAENIISGKYISEDRSVFAYEVQTAENVKTCIVDRTDIIYSYSLGKDCSLDRIYYIEPYTYLYKNDELLLLDNSGTYALIDDGIRSISIMDDALICFKEKSAPYNISVCQGTTVKNRISGVASSNVVFEDEILYYYTGEGSDLNMVESSGYNIALISNIDVTIGFLKYKGTVAVAKKDEKTLFIASRFGITDTELKIKKFITEVL